MISNKNRELGTHEEVDIQDLISPRTEGDSFKRMIAFCERAGVMIDTHRSPHVWEAAQAHCANIGYTPTKIASLGVHLGLV